MLHTHDFGITVNNQCRRLNGLYIRVADIFKGHHSGDVPFKHRLQSFWVGIGFQVGFLQRLGHILQGGIFKAFTCA